MGPRIVSLVPSLTETLFALGLGDNLVGRTHYCVHPAGAVDRVPSLGGTKKIRIDRLKALRPTHVLVNVDETPKPLADAIAALGIELVVTHPLDPCDNPALFRLLGSRFDRVAAAQALAAQFDEAYQAVRAAAAGSPHRPVLYLIWKDPWMTVSRDTYVSRMLDLIGWRTLGHDPHRRYPEIDLFAAAAEADVVLLATEPFPFTDQHVASVRHLTAPRQAILADGQLLSWYGARAVQAMPYLACLLKEASPKVRVR